MPLVLLLPLLFGAPRPGYTNGEPPPTPPGPGEQLSGPATVGTLTFTESTPGLVQAVFNGRCGSAGDVSFSVSIPGHVANVSELKLNDFRVTNGTTAILALAPCYPFSGDLVINTVTRLRNDGTIAIADIVILAVCPGNCRQ
jgi:hypothetical protein